MSAAAQPAPGVPVTVSLFGAAWAPEPTREITGTWDDLVDGIRAGLQRTVPAPRNDSEQAWKRAKRSLPALVCAPFSGSRGDDTVGDHTAVVLDVDRPTPDLLERLERYQAVVYETPSSRREGADDVRLRVVVAITAPVPPHAVPPTRAALARELGLDPGASGVAGADAASQLMFYGRVDGTPEREMWTYDGQPWTPPPPGEAPPRRERSCSEASEPLYASTDIPDLSVLAREIGTLDERGMRRGGRDVCRAIGGMLAKHGWHPEAIEQAVYEQIPSDQPGAEERAPAAREAAEQYYRGQANTIGYGELEKRFGAAVMAELETTLDPWMARLLANWPPKRVANDTTEGEPGDTLNSSWPPPGPTLQITPAADIAAPLPPVDWLCERLGLAVGGRPNLFAAPAGGGKTTTAQALALAVASGSSLFGDGEFGCRQGSVLHLDIDQGAAATKRRYQRLAAGAGLDLRALPLSCVFAPIALAKRDQIDPDALALLARTVRGYDLVIVDSLRALAPSLDEQSSEFGSVLHALQHITFHLGTTWLVIHHSGKSEGTAVRGTSAIRDRAGCVWVLDEGGHWRHDKVSELSESRMPPFTTLCTPSSQGGLEGSLTLSVVQGETKPAGEPTESERMLVREFVTKFPDGVSQRQVEMALSAIGRNRIRDVVQVMLESGELYRSGARNSSTTRLHVATKAQDAG